MSAQQCSTSEPVPRPVILLTKPATKKNFVFAEVPLSPLSLKDRVLAITGKPSSPTLGSDSVPLYHLLRFLSAMLSVILKSHALNLLLRTGQGVL